MGKFGKKVAALARKIGEWHTARPTPGLDLALLQRWGMVYSEFGAGVGHRQNGAFVKFDDVAELQEQVGDLQAKLASERRKREFYSRRCEALQAAQVGMRDPERKMVCDVLANGRIGDSHCGQASQP